MTSVSSNATRLDYVLLSSMTTVILIPNFHCEINISKTVITTNNLRYFAIVYYCCAKISVSIFTIKI